MNDDDDQAAGSESTVPPDPEDAEQETVADSVTFGDDETLSASEIDDPFAAVAGDDALDDAALGQSEIDDLFGISASDEAPIEGIYALLNSQYIRHRRLPVLEACFDRLVHALSKSLRNLTAGDIELSLADSNTVRFGNYIEEVPLPALISIFKVVEWADYGLINIDSGLIYSLIDVMLGGRRATSSLSVETRSFTAIESKLIERMILTTLEDMSAAFKPLSDVTFQLERMEANPTLVDIASPSNLAIIFTIDVNFSDRGGQIEILIPYATLEPMRDLLDQMFTGEKFGNDSIWEAHLTGQMLRADVDLEVTFGHQMVPLSKILSLEVGSTLTLRNKPGDPVTLRCGETAIMNADVGRIGDNIAVQIANWCNHKRRSAPKIDRRSA